MNTIFTLDQIISTLNNIEVKGEGNLDRLLGCIMALKAMQEAMQNEFNQKMKQEQEANENG